MYLTCKIGHLVSVWIALTVKILKLVYKVWTICSISVIVVVNRRIQKKDAMYTYTMNPTGDSVFNDPLEDDISIIHINHDQATVVKPSRNVLLRLKLSLGLKRLKWLNLCHLCTMYSWEDFIVSCAHPKAERRQKRSNDYERFRFLFISFYWNVLFLNKQ